MSSAPPTGPVATLPVWGTVKATFRTVLVENRWHFPRAVFVPLLISLVLLWVRNHVTGSGDPNVDGPASDGFSGIDLLFNLLEAVPYVFFAVAWHRLVLMGSERATPPWAPSWKVRHWIFCGYLILLNLMLASGVIVAVVAVYVVGPNPAVPILLAALFAAGWFMARFSFVLPARALDETYGFGDSWRQTRGQGLRILGAFVFALSVFLLAVLIAGLILAFVGALVGGAETFEFSTDALMSGSLPEQGLGILLGYVFSAIGITVISLAFKTCSGWIAGSDPA